MEFFLRNIYPDLINVAVYSSLLPFLAGLFFFKKRKNRLFKLLFLYVSMTMLMEAISKLSVVMGTTNNMWIGHMFSTLEFVILAIIYYHSFDKPIFKRIILFMTISFVSYSLINAYIGEGLTQMNSTAKIIENALLFSLAGFYFYKVSNDLRITYLERDAVFLLSSAILIYKAGTTMTYAMFNDALAISYDAAKICFTVVLVLNVIYNLSMIQVLRSVTK